MFRKDVIAGNTLSTLRTRVQFTTSQHKRSKYLGKITKYNERLQRLLEGTSQTEVAEFDLRTKFSPSPRLRAMAHTLHDALSRSWTCSCKAPHEEELFEAKLCLNRDPSFKNSFEFSFDILFATRPEKDASCMELSSWHESIIHTAPKGYVLLLLWMFKDHKYFCIFSLTHSVEV
jgi:hypothetical protein